MRSSPKFIHVVACISILLYRLVLLIASTGLHVSLGLLYPTPVFFSCVSPRMASSIFPACACSKNSLRLISGSPSSGDELLHLYSHRNFIYDTHIVQITHITLTLYCPILSYLTNYISSSWRVHAISSVY